MVTGLILTALVLRYADRFVFVCVQAGPCVCRKNKWNHCKVEQEFGRCTFHRPTEIPTATSGCAGYSGV